MQDESPSDHQTRFPLVRSLVRQVARHPTRTVTRPAMPRRDISDHNGA
jgi:hypothetical protein